MLWSTVKTCLSGIMGKTDKYSVFMCSICVPLLGKKEKDAAAKREALNAFKFRPVF